MHNLLMLALSRTFNQHQGATERSAAYRNSSLLSPLTSIHFNGGQAGYETSLKGRARPYQSRRTRSLAKALLAVVAVALPAAYFILQCFMLLKGEEPIAAAVRRLADFGDNCFVSGGEARALISRDYCEKICQQIFLCWVKCRI